MSARKPAPTRSVPRHLGWPFSRQTAAFRQAVVFVLFVRNWVLAGTGHLQFSETSHLRYSTIWGNLAIATTDGVAGGNSERHRSIWGYCRRSDGVGGSCSRFPRCHFNELRIM